jgi:hypothetical protein
MAKLFLTGRNIEATVYMKHSITEKGLPCTESSLKGFVDRVKLEVMRGVVFAFKTKLSGE